MPDGSADILLLVAALLGLFAALATLRILALYRQHEVEPHELAREARRLRAEYEQKNEQADRGKDQIVI